MDAALKSKLVPQLRALGFKGSYPHFRREGEKHMELVGIQFSQWGGQFYVELALGSKDGTSIGDKHVEADQLKHYHGWPRARLGELPYDYERDGVQAAAEKASLLPQQIDAWFLRAS